MRSPSPFLAVVLCATLACSTDDSDVADTQSSDTSETADGTETGAEDGSEAGGPQDFPPVQCEDVTCAEGDLCVEAGPYCDVTGSRPEWVIPTGVCTPYPSECEDLQDYPLQECLWEALCGPSDIGSISDEPGGLQFELGLVECPAKALDCFEDP